MLETLDTAVVGRWCASGLAALTHVARNWPLVEVHRYPGAQSHYPLPAGAE